MRITRDSLLQAARSAAEQQVRTNRNIVCIYLTGSLLSDEPLLGHTTDIDLFCIHAGAPAQPREIVKLSDDVHLDIAHFAQIDFRQPREQRSDPWLSPFICNNPVILHDTQHWFEFTQASICAQYGRPDYTLQRARTLWAAARSLWFELKNAADTAHANKVYTYLRSLERAANAAAALTNHPLTERRFLQQYPQRAQAIGRVELVKTFIDLFTSPEDAAQIPDGWLEDWEQAFMLASQSGECPVRLNDCRLAYYKSAVQALAEDNLSAALWPLLKTWTLCACTLPDNRPVQDKWTAATDALNLSAANLPERIDALDAYLDEVEVVIDAWAADNGISES
jgi:hypothetical protein